MRDLTQGIRGRVKTKLLGLEDDPYKDCTKLASRPGFRARVGDYRVLYEVDDKEKVVTVSQIVHRREAYR